MDNFLVPVDFSDASASALRYAFEFNRHYFAKLHIMHIFDVPFSAAAETDAGMNMYESLKTSFEAKTWDFINANKGEYHYDMQVVVTSGGHYQSIANYAEEHGISLVILGNKGKGGIRKWLFGSVTQYLLRHAPCPVIAVPGDNGWKEIKNICVCTDLSQPFSDEQCAKLKEVSSRFNAPVQFLHVQDKIEIALPEDNIAISKIRKEFGSDPQTLPFADSVGSTINNFIKSNPAELLITVPHYHTWLDKMLLGSETAALSQLVKMPILALP